MSARYGVGDYQYELVEHFPRVPINGVAADVATDSQDQVYVAVRNPTPDGGPALIGPGTGTLLVFDRDGQLLRTWDNHGFSAPHGLWIGPEDGIFHADTGHHTVTKYTPSGQLLMTLGHRDHPGAPGMPFNMPTHAVVAPSGDIFVSDGYGQNRVHRFASSGQLKLSWGKGDPVFLQQFRGEPITGKPGTGPGEFNLPHDVVVDKDNRVYVMDRSNNRCQVFTEDGEYVSEWSDVRGPNKGVIDSNGVMHIVGHEGVELRKLDGTLVGRWGEKGVGPGKFTNSPHGVWIDHHGDMYVAEVGGLNRLQKFARV